MKRFPLNFLLLLVLTFISANTLLAQSNKEITIEPPEWILGSWSNMAVSDLRTLETFTFTANEIIFTRGFVKQKESFYLSEKFEDFKVSQTVESSLYRLEFSKNNKEYIYEFKLCETETCKSFSRKAITYSISENGKFTRKHSESINLVLFKN